MSASSSEQFDSSEEGNRSTALTNSPPGHIHYDPFRHSAWTSGTFNSLTGYTSQRSSPGRADPSRNPLPFELRSADPTMAGSSDNNPTRPPLPSPPATQLSPLLAQDPTRRSAPGQLGPFGTRPDSHESHGYPAGPLSSSYPGLESGYSNYPSDSNIATRGSRPPRWHNPRGDVFDGPSQFLPLPLPQEDFRRAQALPQLPTNLSRTEQEEVARRSNDILAHCAYHFVAKYQFPIPLEHEKPRVRQASDREWTEWAYLLKKLATKRRIPARVLFNGQIKQFVTTLENSIAVRQAINNRTDPPTPRQPRDDRYMLQLISAGLQVAKILQDSVAMEQLNQLYVHIEGLILERRSGMSSSGSRGNDGLAREARPFRGAGGRNIGGGGIGAVGSRSSGSGGGGGGDTLGF